MSRWDEIEGLLIQLQAQRAARYARIAQHQWAFRVRLGESQILEDYRSRAELNARGTPSKLVTMPNVKGRYLPLRAPKTFSFIENPNTTIEFINTMIGEILAGTRALYIDQRRQERIDLCAGAVLNAIAEEARTLVGTRFAGRYPQTPESLEMVVAAGLPALFHVHDIHLPNVKTFEVRRGERKEADGTTSSRVEHISHSLMSYVEACFARHNRSLAGSDVDRLGKIIGEVMANASEYGNGQWWTSGYMRTRPDGQVGECHLAFFNFGPSMAESIRTLRNGELRTEIEELVSTHRTRSFFGLAESWTEDALWTLYALQEFVTCHHGTDGNVRGLGTAEIFSAFQALCSSDDDSIAPKMCLVSGHVHFLFDGRYPMAEDADGRRILALNAANDLRQPPDKGVVTILQKPFPGTLLSLRFFLDSRPSSAKPG